MHKDNEFWDLAERWKEKMAQNEYLLRLITTPQKNNNSRYDYSTVASSIPISSGPLAHDTRVEGASITTPIPRAEILALIISSAREDKKAKEVSPEFWEKLVTLIQGMLRMR